MKKELIIKRAKNKTFADRLAEQLRPLGEVENDSHSDMSGSWVGVKIGNITLNFELDNKGEVLESIGIYKDIWQVVEQKQIFKIHKKS